MYGVFGLSASWIAILVIVAVVTWLLAIVFFENMAETAGWAAQFVAVATVLVLMVTWLTSLSDYTWSEWGPFPVVGAIIVVIVTVAPGIHELN